MIQMTSFKGKAICGVPLKDSDNRIINYKNADRPPEFSSCSSKQCGKGDSAICLSYSEAKCPVTGIKAVHSSDYDGSQATATDEVINFEDTVLIFEHSDQKTPVSQVMF